MKKVTKTQRKAIPKVSLMLATWKADKNGSCPLYLAIRRNSEEEIISTTLKTPAKKWNKKTQKIKGNSEHNDFLELQKKELHQIILALEAKGKAYDLKTVVGIFKGEIKDNYIWSDLIRNYIEYRQDEVRQGTLKNWLLYERTWQRFLNWLGISKGFTAPEITIRIYKDFLFYAQKHTDEQKIKKWSDNHINKIVCFWGQVGKHAVFQEYIESNPFESISYPRNAKQNFVYLNTSSLLKIQNYQYYSTALEKVKDLFCFQYNTGLAYIDMYNLSSDNIRQGNHDNFTWLRIHRQKTGTKAELPLRPEALAVLKKYNGVDNLPKISSQKYNQYLKEIANILGIDMRLTSHVARYTFANLALNTWGISIETVSAMLGHKDIRTTQRFYATVREQRISQEMQKVMQSESSIIKPSNFDVKKFGKGGSND